MNHKLSTAMMAVLGAAAIAVAPVPAQQPPPPAQPAAQPAAQQAAPVGSKLPRIQASAEEFDFGRVPQGATISHVFWLKNVGEDTLRITDVKPG